MVNLNFGPVEQTDVEVHLVRTRKDARSGAPGFPNAARFLQESVVRFTFGKRRAKRNRSFRPTIGQALICLFPKRALSGCEICRRPLVCQ